MDFVEPIREYQKISNIKNLLKSEDKIRDLLLFELWINSALRISDLLKIKVKDLFDDKWAIRDSFEMKEKKTSKGTRVTITPKVKETLKLYKDEYKAVVSDPESFIFFHRKLSPLWIKGIDRRHAWTMISTRCKLVGLKWNFGWHTLRKTRWYQARIQWVALELIQHKLNHSSLSVTKRYLGIADDEIQDVCNKLDL